jgi:hypothetical protein
MSSPIALLESMKQQMTAYYKDKRQNGKERVYTVAHKCEALIDFVHNSCYWTRYTHTDKTSNVTIAGKNYIYHHLITADAYAFSDEKVIANKIEGSDLSHILKLGTDLFFN